MKKLPIDVSTFSIMIEQGYLYVDKTQQIYDLVTQGRFYFLSRPRRFGKTLLISTLNELFSGNKKLFKNLWIENSNYDWIQHPVINLSFARLDIETSQEVKTSLSQMLNYIAQQHLIDLSSATTPKAKIILLTEELYKKTKKPVVILIDEYDFPLVNNLDTPRIAEANRKVLKSFFAGIKDLDPILRAIFITGVSKFAKTSLFSGLNNLNDLTVDTRAATLLGYTQKEIDTYFEPYIKEIAEENNLTIQQVKDKLQKWYNGYRFSKLEIKVFNPFSILYYFVKKDLANYWFGSGTPSFLVELLKKDDEILKNIRDLKLSAASLGAFELKHIQPITLLFQTGYLTIADYDKETNKYSLCFPNQEVEESFEKYLFAAFLYSDIASVDVITYRLINALNQNDLDQFCQLLQSLFAHIPYQLHITQEAYYHSLFQLLSNILNIETHAEVGTDKGRIDLVIITKTHVYIFEIKLNKDPKIGLQQIEDRKYYQKYQLLDKQIVIVGLTFWREKKRLTVEHVSKNL